MRFSETPQGKPGTCAILPGRAQDPEGWVVTGHIVPGWDPEMCFSFAGINELASHVGLPRRQEWVEKQKECEQLHARIADLEHELNEQAVALDAVDALTKREYVIRKQTGRPKGSKDKKTKEEAVA